MWCGLVAFSATIDLMDVDVAQRVHQHRHRHADNSQAEENADPLPADIFLE